MARISRHHHFNLSTYGVAHAVLVAVDFPASEPDASTQAVGRYVVAEGDGRDAGKEATSEGEDNCLFGWVYYVHVLCALLAEAIKRGDEPGGES